MRRASISTPKSRAGATGSTGSSKACATPRPDYKALNDFRTELFKLRTDGEDFWKKLEPVLNSANDDVRRCLPRQLKARRRRPEQAAIYRAETNAYHAYLTSTRGTLDGTQNRIGKLLGQLLDIRRSRYSRQTVSALPGGVFSRDLGSRARTNPGIGAPRCADAVVGWWRAQEQDQILSLAGVALALWAGFERF